MKKDSQEKKLDNSFPVHSIEYVLNSTNTKLENIDCVSYSWFKGFQLDTFKLYLNRLEALNKNNSSKSFIINDRINWEIKRDTAKRKEIDQWLFNNVILNNIVFEDFHHHEAHAASAAFFSPFNDGIVMTCDARGDFESLTMWDFNRNRKNPLKKIYSSTSLGLFRLFLWQNYWPSRIYSNET